MARVRPAETQTKQRERRSSIILEAILEDTTLDTQQKRRSVASWACGAESTGMYGKSSDQIMTCGCWSEKRFALKLALMVLGMAILLLRQYFTLAPSLRQHMIESSFLAVGGKTRDLVVTTDSELTMRKVDATLGGLLLPSVIFEDKCISRSQEHSLRGGPSAYKPSPELISKLREYELRHRRCAPQATNFSPWRNTTEHQEFGDCRFIVWIAAAGLGNRVMTLASAFVYALLTDRVLLIDRTGNPEELFCEPFPGSSWLLPESFPHEWMKSLDRNSSCRFGSMMQAGNLTSSDHNGYAYIDMMHDYDYNDQKFFCAHCQSSLSRFPWLLLKSNQYYIPGFHFIPEFHADLDKLFPERETVFHHVVRYLLHPSDSVWTLISRFYNTNLASAQRHVGLQIRIFFRQNITLTTRSDMLLKCALENKLLPNVTLREDHVDDAHLKKNTAILVASLHEVFHERLRGFYENDSAPDAQHLGVYTASHEDEQNLESLDHDMKALADMYLLSFSDELLTSARSTFGYVAQGIAGVTPWILTHFESAATMEEEFRDRGPCYHGVSLEPCFHMPPALDCDNKGLAADPVKALPYIQPCEDVWWGIKIMEPRL